MENTCLDCLWHDQCKTDNVCDDFTPVDEEKEIEDFVEEKRKEFNKEYFEYEKEYSDGRYGQDYSYDNECGEDDK